MALPNDTLTLPDPIYGEVKAWIALQEDYERQNLKRAPLTNAQRAALEALRPLPRRLPSVGNANWVGILNECNQQFTAASDSIVNTELESGTVLAGGTTGRICLVTISKILVDGTAGTCTFPSPGAGCFPSEHDASAMRIPVFAIKKVAKQYAAKCACEYLVKHGRMPRQLRTRVETEAASVETGNIVAKGVTAAGLVDFPPPGVSSSVAHSLGSMFSSSLSAQPKGTDENLDGGVDYDKYADHSSDDDDDDDYGSRTARTQHDNTNNITSNREPLGLAWSAIRQAPIAGYQRDHNAAEHVIGPVSSTTTPISDPCTDVTTNATKLVMDLCSRLGLPPPRYNITSSLASGRSSRGGFMFVFDGVPEFANQNNDEELMSMSEYARLVGVAARSQEIMKSMVASKLLVKLREIEAARRAMFEMLLKK